MSFHIFARQVYTVDRVRGDVLMQNLRQLVNPLALTSRDASPHRQTDAAGSTATFGDFKTHYRHTDVERAVIYSGLPTLRITALQHAGHASLHFCAFQRHLPQPDVVQRLDALAPGVD